MEYYIKIITPGSHLSTDTLLTLVTTLRKDFESGFIEALISEFPKASRAKIREGVRGHISFEFEEMRRGSWEIIFQGATGLFLGKLMYDLGKDLILKHPTWERFKEKFYSKTSKKGAEEIKENIEERKTIGPFFIKEINITITDLANEDSRINVEMKLVRKKENPTYSTSEEIEEALKDYFLEEQARDKDKIK